jgi:hypothetical protein
VPTGQVPARPRSRAAAAEPRGRVPDRTSIRPRWRSPLSVEGQLSSLCSSPPMRKAPITFRRTKNPIH